MPEGQKPKNQVPIKNYPTPSWGDAPVDGISVVDEYLREYIECNKSNYVPLPPGSPYPDTVKFPNHRLLREENVSEGLNLRHWCNGYRNEDLYNYDINYSGEENSHPIFSRRYLVRRDLYDPLVKESKFTGIYQIRVTDAGSGYTSDNPPTVTISGGGGAGATAIAIVGPGGTLDWIYLTAEGSGYTSQPTVTIGSGTATAEALLQLDTGVVYLITVTAGGTGYVTAPVVTITGDGTLATAVAQIQGGEVKAVGIVAYGKNYTTATVSFGGPGTGATATATIETATCRLIKEDAQQLPEDDPRRSLYLLITRQYETFPGPYLVEHRYEKYLDYYVTTRKRVVLGSQVPPDMTYVARTPGQIIEYHPLSKHRAIEAISQINTGLAWENDGEDFEYFGTANYTFPNEITSNPEIHVYYAFSGAKLAIDFQFRLNVEEGYSGPCSARFLRRYTFDPESALFQADLPTVTYIKPEADIVQTGFVYVGDNLIAQGNNFPIPSSLHEELDIQVITNGLGGGAPVVTIDTVEATVPTSLPPGTEICVSVKPTLYDFGLWVYDIVFVTVPSPP